MSRDKDILRNLIELNIGVDTLSQQLAALNQAVTLLTESNEQLVTVITQAIGSVGSGESVNPTELESVTTAINTVTASLEKAVSELKTALEKVTPPKAVESPAATPGNPPEQPAPATEVLPADHPERSGP